mgnify:FL=1
MQVATAPTACGIETAFPGQFKIASFYMLQQHLPLAVLKRSLQQLMPWQLES